MLNEKIDEIMERHEKVKAEKKKMDGAFTCPYCGRQYMSENLRHLLGCALKNPGHEKKLKDFFDSWVCLPERWTQSANENLDFVLNFCM